MVTRGLTNDPRPVGDLGPFGGESFKQICLAVKFLKNAWPYTYLVSDCRFVGFKSLIRYMRFKGNYFGKVDRFVSSLTFQEGVHPCASLIQD